MATIDTLFPDVESILGCKVQDLAGHLLEHLHSLGPDRLKETAKSLLIREIGLLYQEKYDLIVEKIAEAWHQLEQTGCVIQHPTRSIGYYFITAKGMNLEKATIPRTEDATGDEGRDVLADLSTGERLGSFVLRRRLGEGGMGRVYLAENPQIGQKVAIKFLLPKYRYSSEFIERFKKEAYTLTQIRHPGVVRILGFDYYPSDQPTLPYIIMEFMEGKLLLDIIKSPEPPLKIIDVIIYVRQIANALSVIHERSIFHRDLKPSNIIIVSDTTEPSGSRAVLLDFGVAKAPNTVFGESKTKMGDPIGTVEYMAPEQVLDASLANAKTDVFAFGLILRQLLNATVKRSGVDFEKLSCLAARMLAPEPTRRPTINEILTLLQSNKVHGIQAHEFENNQLEQKSVTTPTKGMILHRHKKTLFGDYSSASWSPNGSFLATGSNDGTITLWTRDRWARCASLSAHENAVSSIAWSSDSIRLASCSADKIIHIWNGQEIAMNRMTLDAIQASSQDPTNTIYQDQYRQHVLMKNISANLNSEKIKRPILSIKNLQEKATIISWSSLSHKHTLASGHSDGSLRIWEIDPNAKLRYEIKRHSGQINDLAWSPDGLSLATCSADKTIRIWDLDTGGQRRILNRHTDAIGGIFWFPDGQRLASISFDGTIRIWDAESGRQEESVALGGPGLNIALTCGADIILARVLVENEKTKQERNAHWNCQITFLSAKTFEVIETESAFTRKFIKSGADILITHPQLTLYSTTDLDFPSPNEPEETLKIHEFKAKLPEHNTFVLDTKLGKQAVVELDMNGEEISNDNKSGSIERYYKKLITGRVIGFALPGGFSLSGIPNSKAIEVENLFSMAKEAGYEGTEDLNQMAAWAGMEFPSLANVKGDILTRVRLMAKLFRYIETKILAGFNN